MTNEDTAWEQFSKADGTGMMDQSAGGMLQAILAELNSVKADTARLAQKIDGGAGDMPPVDEGMPPAPMDDMSEEAMTEETPAPMPAPSEEDFKSGLIADGLMAPDVPVPELPPSAQDETLSALQDALTQVTDPMAISKLADIIKDYVAGNYGAEAPVEPAPEAPLDIPPEVIVDALAGGAPAGEPPVEDVPPELMDALLKSDDSEKETDEVKKSGCETEEIEKAEDAEPTEPSVETPSESVTESDVPEEDQPAIQINLFLGAKMEDIIKENEENGLTKEEDLPTESFKVCDPADDKPFKRSIDDLINQNMRKQIGVDGKRYQIAKSASEKQREEFISIQKSIGSIDAVKGMRVGDVLTTMQGLGARGHTSIEKSYEPIIDEMVKYCDNFVGPQYTQPLLKSFGVDVEKIYEPTDVEAFTRNRFGIPPNAVGAGINQFSPRDWSQLRKLLQIGALFNQDSFSNILNNSFGSSRNIDDVLSSQEGDTDVERMRNYLGSREDITSGGYMPTFDEMSDEMIQNIIDNIRGRGRGRLTSAMAKTPEDFMTEVRGARRAKAILDRIAQAGSDISKLDISGLSDDPQIQVAGKGSGKKLYAQEAKDRMNADIYGLMDYLKANDPDMYAELEPIISRKREDAPENIGKAKQSSYYLPYEAVYGTAGYDYDNRSGFMPDPNDPTKSVIAPIKDVYSAMGQGNYIDDLLSRFKISDPDTIDAVRNLISSGGEEGADVLMAEDAPENVKRLAGFLKDRLGYGFGGIKNPRIDMGKLPKGIDKYLQTKRQGDTDYLFLTDDAKKKISEWDTNDLLKKDSGISDSMRKIFSGKPTTSADVLSAARDVLGPNLNILKEAGAIQDVGNISDEEMASLAQNKTIGGIREGGPSLLDRALKMPWQGKGASPVQKLTYMATNKMDPAIGDVSDFPIYTAFSEKDKEPFKTWLDNQGEPQTPQDKVKSAFGSGSEEGED